MGVGPTVFHIIRKNGQRRYKYLVLGRDRSYFVRKKNTTRTDTLISTPNLTVKGG